MRCPACGNPQKAHYERCLSCGTPMYEEVQADDQYDQYGEREQQEQRGQYGRQSRQAQQPSQDPRYSYEQPGRSGRGRERQQPTNYNQQDPNSGRNHQYGEDSDDSDYDEIPRVQSRIRMRQGSGGVKADEGAYDVDDSEPAYRPARRSSHTKQRSRFAPLLTVLGIIFVIGVAGAGAFYLIMKAPDDKRLQDKGEHELANAQYAFAVQSLSKAVQLNPHDAKLYLELARAYVGIDQVDKAWDCVGKAEKLGSGVIGEPTLASDLANYYRRRGKFQKAVELLQPLAKAGVVGKKAELADLDAAWGDELLSEGKIEESLRCWEEVRDTREGSRFGEAEARLSTIYQRLANNLSSKKDDEAALAYLTKLNNIAQSPRNYEMASDIYEREGKLDLAIEQLRKASNLAGKNASITQKLGALLSRRGKELLDDGDTDAGYGYLQQAKDLNPQQNALPKATLRSVAVSYDPQHQPRITGEMWNPTTSAISALALKVELWDNDNDKSLWQKEQRLVDQFTPPMNGHEGRSFDLTVPMSIKSDGSAELRTYIDGELYKAYPLGARDKNATTGGAQTASASKAKNTPSPKVDTANGGTNAGASAPTPGGTTPTSQAANQMPAPVVAPSPSPASSARGSSEEKTMRDLEN
jgi:tetratricopeptide (TPR) repeat protein